MPEHEWGFDKIVLVTGGSSGIGAAIAGEFARHRLRVAITARDLRDSGQRLTDGSEWLAGPRHRL